MDTEPRRHNDATEHSLILNEIIFSLFLMNNNHMYPYVTSRGQNPLKRYLKDLLDGHLFILDENLSKLLLDLNV